jgi:hypothetical protein
MTQISGADLQGVDDAIGVSTMAQRQFHDSRPQTGPRLGNSRHGSLSDRGQRVQSVILGTCRELAEVLSRCFYPDDRPCASIHGGLLTYLSTSVKLYPGARIVNPYRAHREADPKAER